MSLVILNRMSLGFEVLKTSPCALGNSDWHFHYLITKTVVGGVTVFDCIKL